MLCSQVSAYNRGALVKAVIVLIITSAGPLIAQQPPSPAQSPLSAAANPLAESKEEVQRVLAEAGVPFTEDDGML